MTPDGTGPPPEIEAPGRSAPEASGRALDLADLEERLGPAGPTLTGPLVEALGAILGGPLRADRFSVQGRAAALGRPMVVVHLAWPRHRTRLALGVDLPLAHALVDRLLGFERDLAELHLQVTPVEWGILGFLAAAGLEWLEAQPGPLGPWDLVIDRIGPGPFDIAGLGPVVTFRWRVQLGNTTGSARLWLPEPLLTLGLDRTSARKEPVINTGLDESKGLLDRLADLVVEWRIVAGTATVPVGPDGPHLRVGQPILLDGAPLEGHPLMPTGPVTLMQDCGDGSRGASWRGTLAPAPDGRSGHLTVTTLPRSRLPLDACDGTDAVQSSGEVGLTVTIGSLRLALGRLATLRPGDVLQIEPDLIGPVELKLRNHRAAIGELIAVDPEIGVKILAVTVRPRGVDPLGLDLADHLQQEDRADENPRPR